MRNQFFELLESRQLLSGDVDLSFGSGGKVTGHAKFPADVGLGLPSAADIALQADGKSLVVGSIGSKLLVARFNVNGSLDANYGSGGIAVIDFGGSGAAGNAIVLDSSGRAVVAGYAVNSANTKTSFAVARLTTSGQLDKTFSGDGMLTTPFAQKTAIANDLAIGSNGRIVAAGYSADGAGTARFAVARYKTDGSLDKEFSVDGLQTIDIDSGNDVANAVAVLGDGSVLMAGYLTKAGADSDMAVVRVTASGQKDNSFDGNGIAAVDFGGNDLASSLLVDGNKYVLAGSTDKVIGDPGAHHVAVARLTSAGSPDSSFNAYDLSLARNTSDDRVFLGAGTGGGYRLIENDSGLIFETRLLASGALDPNFEFGGQQEINGVLPQPVDFNHIKVGAALFLGNGQSVVALNPSGTGDFAPPAPLIQVVHLDNSDTIAAGTKLGGPIITQQIGDAAVTLDGKLAMVGLSDLDYVFYRFKSDGKLDTSFAGDGRAEFIGPTSEFQGSPTLFVRADGSLVGYGTDADLVDQDGIAAILRRVSSNGTPDTKYASDHTAWGIIDDESGGAHVELLPGGYISITYDQFTLNQKLGTLVRPDGSAFDPVIPQGEFTDNDTPFTSSIRPIGKSDAVFVTGLDQDEHGKFPVIAKYLANGKLDMGFDGDGILKDNFDLVAAQADGKFLYRAGGGLKRRTATGALDLNFGTNGIAAAGYVNFTFDSLDRVIAWKTLANGDIQVARFTPDGKTDTRFGNNGVATVHPTVKGTASVIVDANDNLVVGTLKKNSSSDDWFATRLLGGGFADLKSGKLIVSGSTARDNISLSSTSSLVNVTVNGKSKSFSRSQVSSIEINSFAGDDTVSLSSTFALGVKISGGDGNDRFNTKDGKKDFLDGGAGFDTVKRDKTASVKDSVLNIESFV